MQGQKVGNYKIAGVIGEGGMGAVYRAVHEALGRAVAVKVLLPEISSSRDMVTRFFNEARSVASIRHPGIVEAYDFGFLPDGRAYIIMELLEGETLGQRLRRGQRMPHARGLQIARSLARSLHAAHEQGIVHRDIKPDNIFLVPDPETAMGERVKILDFGLAKLSASETEPNLTRTGSVMGTPRYMAPEQCRGAGAVDRRADLYALGCILYELLCGRPPFLGEGVGELIGHHLYIQPEPPRAHDPSVEPALEALVLALLEKDPAKRPPTGQAVAEAIEQLGVPVNVVPVPLHSMVRAPTDPSQTTLSGAIGTLGPNAPVPARRRRVAIAVGATAAVTGIAIAAVVAGGDPDPVGAPVAAGSAIDALPEPTGSAAGEPTPPADADGTDVAEALVPAPADAGSEQEAEPAAPPEPRTVSAPELEARRLSGRKDIAPDAATLAALAKSGKGKLEGTFELCLNADGVVTSVSSMASTGFPEHDARIVDGMKRWTYKPYVLDGEAVPVCAAMTFVYSPPASSGAGPTCSRSSFASVLQAKQLDQATARTALVRLKQCQHQLGADVYADLQQQIIGKL